MRISDWSSDVCSSDLQVTPPVRVRGGSDDLGARMDPVHLARLRKGEETFVVDMIQEMLFSREPEALFDIVKLLPKRHRLCSFRGRQDLPRLCGYPLFSGQTRAEEAVRVDRSEEHTSELQSLMRISY